MTNRALKVILISLVLTISTVPQYTYAQTAEQNATSRRANLPIIQKSKTTPSLTQARKFYIQGKYNQAIKTYKSLLANPALAISARIGLAKTYAIIGRYDDAIKTLKLCAQRAADNADWHVLISGLFVKKGDYHQALRPARKAFFISKEWAPAI